MVTVTPSVAPGLGFTSADVRHAKLYTDWVGKFDTGWKLLDFAVSAGVAWKGTVRMLCAKATMQDPDGQHHARVVFLRGGTVDVLVVLATPDGREFVAFIEEKRVAIGQTFLTNPAGMIDEGELPVMSAIREVGEEVGEMMTWGKPISLNKKILGKNVPMLVSPGGTDEGVFFYAMRTVVTNQQLKAIDGATGGLAAEGELTTVRIMPIGEAIKALGATGKADLKAVSSLEFYRK